MNELRLSLIQSFLYWEDARLNRQMFSWKVRDLAGETDLIVLPEMFTTGFSMKPEKIAEPPGGPTTEWMVELAHETGAVITGSLIIHQNEAYYNRLLWVQPDGIILHYDKRHLFSMAGEDQVYTAGHERLIAEWKGWRICPLICYDLRFPSWCRNTVGYDLLLFVANWPEPRRMHWQHLLKSRAIENLAYVAGVNRIGRDDNGHDYWGDTMILHYRGEILSLSTLAETTQQVTLQKDSLDGWRQRFPFLEDRDDVTINL